MERFVLDTSLAESFIQGKMLKKIPEEMEGHFKELTGRKGRGNDFLGWLDLPSQFPEELLKRIRDDASAIRDHSEILVVIGIGGSYLGARAVIEALTPGISLPGIHPAADHPFVVYAGNSLSEDYHRVLAGLLDSHNYSVAVISKSGTTTEPAVAFRFLKNHLEKKAGKQEARKRIFAVTDAARGSLKKLADTEGYSSYVIPDDVGGRYSVLTPVGLLPIAAAGYDIGKLLGGARMMEEKLKQSPKYADNPALQYAGIRNLLYRTGKAVEILVSFEPGMQYFIEWWKQLFGESEGKEQKGIFPAGVGFTTDLHSMGQFIQEGSRNLFETVLSFDKPIRGGMEIPHDPENLDGLNFLTGKNLHSVNLVAEQGTRLAHVDGGVPNMRIRLPGIDEEVLGQLIYFFEFACAVSGYALGVNPFDQPGVEAYKKNMFALLGKPGFEKEGEKLRGRLK